MRTGICALTAAALLIAAGGGSPLVATPPPTPHADVERAYADGDVETAREIASRYLDGYFAKLEEIGDGRPADRDRGPVVSRLLHLLVVVIHGERLVPDSVLQRDGHPFRARVLDGLDLGRDQSRALAARSGRSPAETGSAGYRSRLLGRAARDLILVESAAASAARLEGIYREFEPELSGLGFDSAQAVLELDTGPPAVAPPSEPPPARQLSAVERARIRGLLERFWRGVIERNLDELESLTDFDTAQCHQFLARWDDALEEEGIAVVHSVRLLDELPARLTARPGRDRAGVYSLPMLKVEVDGTFQDGSRRKVETEAVVYLRAGAGEGEWRITWPLRSGDG